MLIVREQLEIQFVYMQELWISFTGDIPTLLFKLLLCPNCGIADIAKELVSLFSPVSSHSKSAKNV